MTVSQAMPINVSPEISRTQRVFNQEKDVYLEYRLEYFPFQGLVQKNNATKEHQNEISEEPERIFIM